MTYSYQYARRRKHHDGGFTQRYVLNDGVFSPDFPYIGQRVYHRIAGRLELYVADFDENRIKLRFVDTSPDTWYPRADIKPVQWHR